MAVVETDSERYADPAGFAREVNLPLLGTARVRPVPSGATLAQLLDASSGSEALGPVVDSLIESRRSLTVRSLLVAGFPHDPECFAVGLAVGREWSRRGIRVAVIDLDFWNPTIHRPPSHPNEGLIDVLEYGCSFGRVAWEIVADRLWMIGPGSHPPEESRITEHPDWPRAARVLAANVDVALYVAPLLDRRGFTGKLSKRMDAALLAASTERIGRADLRDAFLELWGSDAPMIGCVGIDPVDARASARRPDRGESFAAAADPADLERGAGRGERPSSVKAYADEVARAAAPASSPSPARPASVAPPRPPAEARGAGDARVERDLEAALERDVRRGIVEKRAPSRRGQAVLWIAIAAAFAVVAGGLAVIQANRSEPPRGSEQANQPAGEEPIAGGNLDVPGAVPGPKAGAGEVGSVTALGTEVDKTPAAGAPAGTGPASTPPAGASASSPVAPAAGSPANAPPATPTPAATPTGGALRADLGPGAPALPIGGARIDSAKPFRVHVASFRTKNKVEEIVRSLQARKLDAWFEPPPEGGTWYRVFVGHFATEAEAATYARWLVKSGAADRAESYPQTKR
jgi:sporulation related protein